MILPKLTSAPARTLLAIAVILADQITKYAAQQKFFFKFKIIYNPDLPFGLGGSDFFNFIIVLVSLALFIFLYLLFWPRKENWTGFILIVSGAVSNLLDRLGDGAVTDFIFLWVTTLNLADIAIMVGIVFLIVNLGTEEQSS